MYIRTYEIIFGATFTIVNENEKNGNDVLNVSKVNGVFVDTSDLDDYLSSNSKTIYKITCDSTQGETGLNIDFAITKNAKSSRNKHSQIIIYNLSDAIVSYLQQNAKNNIVLLFKGGYADTGNNTLFKGTVAYFTDIFQGSTRATTIYLTDGNVNLKEAFSNRSYPSGTKVDSIVSDLLGDMGLPTADGKIAKWGSSEVTDKPYYYSGLTVHALNKWAKDYKMNFSIQDGKLNYMPIDGRTNSVAYVVDDDSGLVGNIVPKNDNTSTMSLDTTAKGTTLKLTMLLNGAITPEDTILINSGDYKGTYLKVTSVVHRGQLFGNEWWTHIEGKIVDNVYTSGTEYVRS